jgi:methyl-accepting chemotaxis protein
MDHAKRHGRRIKVVDGRFQYRMIAISLTVVTVGLLIVAAATVLFSLATRGPAGLPTPETLRLVLPALLLNDLVIMALVVVVGIFTTQRIAGPVYRIESDIDRVLSGEEGVRVRLRGRDSFPDLAEKVNQLIERIEETRKG